MSKKSLYATLIGINNYKQAPLRGCINEVLSMDQFLRELCAQQPPATAIQYAPCYLLAPNDTDLPILAASPLANVYQPPTFKHITTTGFAHLKQANPGDICLFYYCGHGSQMEAPAPFWHNQSDKLNETIVCADSREPGNRDLTDKELAWLLWDLQTNRQVTCLVIMDCCHSGNNTRNITAPAFTARSLWPGETSAAITEYLGYKEGFYSQTNGKISFPIADYVQLAACLSHEKAVETSSSGIFTSSLLALLRAGGTGSNYRSLMQTLGVTISARFGNQHPVAFAQQPGSLEKQFLSQQLIPYQPFFDVTYNAVTDKWTLQAGAIQGIMAQTIVEISEQQQQLTVPVTTVFPSASLLDHAAMQAFNKENGPLKARLSKVPGIQMRVAIDEKMKASAKAQLEQAYQQGAYPYFQLCASTAPDVSHIIRLTENDMHILHVPGNNTALFKREGHAPTFLQHVNEAGNWQNALQLSNTASAITAADFIFTWELIEGILFDETNINLVKGVERPISPGEEVVLSYQQTYPPAFRLSISLAPGSAISVCHFSALYLGPFFEINPYFIDPAKCKLTKDNAIHLVFPYGSQTCNAIPIKLTDDQKDMHVHENIDYLKLVVSTQHLDLQSYAQAALEPDNGDTKRAAGFQTRRPNSEEQTDWTVFTYKIRCVDQDKTQPITQGRHEFPGFTLEVPAALPASMKAINGRDLQNMAPLISIRNKAYSDPVLYSLYNPPDALWEGVQTGAPPLSDAQFAADGDNVQVLEIIPDNEQTLPVITPGKPLVIRLRNRVRDLPAPGMDEVILPYGFDPVSELYIPVGYSDADGNIYIETLLSPTPGQLDKQQLANRSLGGSIKLYFKKLFRHKQLNKLVLYGRGNDGWTLLTTDPANMQPQLAAKPAGHALLLVHGIIGDTKDMLEVFKKSFAAPGDKGVDFLLTYDYENLSTAIPATATLLAESLKLAGFGNTGMPSLTIVAHSMGGLISRWMIEQGGGHAYVKKLVMAGTPCAGADIASLLVSVPEMLTHAMNASGPLKYAVAGLSFLVKKLKMNPLQTLQELSPSSPTLSLLENTATPAATTYYMVGGDTTLLKDNYDGNDRYLQKIAQSLRDNVVLPGLTLALNRSQPNDMVVTLQSMRSIPSFDMATRMVTVPCTHISYFQTPASMQVLETFIGSSL